MKKTIIKSEFCGTYEVREEHHSDFDITMETAYTFDNYYIGDRKTAEFLCLDKGVAPELIDPAKNVCSIGFCRDRNTWAGWSHRSYAEFGIDSEVKKGDCAYISNNLQELYEDAISWNGEEAVSIDKTNNRIVIDPSKAHIEEPYISEPPLDSALPPMPEDSIVEAAEPNIHYMYPGKGEWSAKTLGEAKQMAIDFAESVS